jgi:hypothetical protein
MGKVHSNKGWAPTRPRAAVPGWVDQLPTERAQQRFFKVVTTKDHPEVAELLRLVMQNLGWLEDLDVGNGGCAGPEADIGVQRSKQKPDLYLWNLIWTWSNRVHVPEGDLFVWQKINHFQGCRCGITTHVAIFCTRCTVCILFGIEFLGLARFCAIVFSCVGLSVLLFCCNTC